MTDKQKLVFDAVKNKIENEDWYGGVCIDNMPPDRDIDNDFESCVCDVLTETMYWDAPNHGLDKGHTT